ncbi:uncharacterized protein LOC115388394 [Salarias fasciatus]|uniref:Interleukin-1 beta n=1 Tax=Salarias fasciatus TaxID=181472 RepID=A0A672FY38_SALFA|nr:uncharacterized protein LOC115388394 [Salarias fasciatus]
MDPSDSVVDGGFLIAHQTHDGKHQYQVENVVKRQKGTWKKTFVRKGDKLMQINGMDLEDFPPEELAHMLAEGNAMLTVHKPGKKEEQPPEGEDILRPFSKETVTLSFSWEMTREEASEDKGERQEAEDKEGGDTQEECKEGGDLLIIEMTKTSISLVNGRSCDPESPCHGCNSTGCAFNDIVLVSETSKVTLVPRGGGSFKQEKLLNALVEHIPSHRYIRGACSQRAVYASPNPEMITIYRYKSNFLDKCFVGVPVVLNLTGSSCFLRCCKSDCKVLLQVEVCEKQKLKQISKSDESALSYVFYMKGDRSGHRTFESALHKGWFIHVVNTDRVEVRRSDTDIEERSFLVIIQK